MKKLVLGFMVMMMLMTVAACKRDIYGDIFINRDPVTFYVHSSKE